MFNWFRPDTRVYDKKASAFPPGFDNFGVFDNAEWLAASIKYVRGLREARQNGTLVPEPYLVAARDLVTATVEKNGRVSVLDYGGGIGPCIDPLTYQVPESAVSYVSVDGPKNASDGYKLFGTMHGVRFETEISAALKTDIVLMSSALQYLTDWRKDLNAALDTNPEHVVLSRLPVGVETIAVRQRINLGNPPKFRGHVWHWIFGKDVDDALAVRGYASVSEEPIRDLTDELKPIGIEADLRVRVYRKQ